MKKKAILEKVMQNITVLFDNYANLAKECRDLHANYRKLSDVVKKLASDMKEQSEDILVHRCSEILSTGQCILARNHANTIRHYSDVDVRKVILIAEKYHELRGKVSHLSEEMDNPSATYESLREVHNLVRTFLNDTSNDS